MRGTRPIERLRSVSLELLASLVATLLLLECTLRAADHFDVATPAPRFTRLEDMFYRDENPDFGVWHPSNPTFRAKADCFEVVYTSNSYGARDAERSLGSAAPRAAVLGDSFVEGIGAELGERMTDVLEQQTGIEHLNFGMAGGFSSVQEALLYETLAAPFEHDLVLLFVFPNDDFIENDPERFWPR